MDRILNGGAVCGVLLALGAAANGAVWRVSPAVTDGMTGPEQITNAVARLASGDTILVAPGMYDFTGVYMGTAHSGGGKVHLTRNANPVKTFSLVGDVSSHWGEGERVVFTGDAQFADFWADAAATGWRGPHPVFANLVFDGFAPEAPTAGAALSFREWTSMERDWPTATNCVFRNCRAVRGGAIAGGVKAVDCLFDGNEATGGDGGGAIDGGAAYSSTFVANKAPFGGALCIRKVTVSNTSYAVSVEVSNCLFRANVAANATGDAAGGALCFKDVGGRVLDCAFVSNACEKIASSYYPKGGAVAGAAAEPVFVARCTFDGNASGYHAGAVSHAVVEDSVFTGNHAYAAGGAVYGCTARRCAFDGDWSSCDWLQPGTAYGSALWDCTVRGALCNSAATRCVFDGVDYKEAFAVFYNRNWVTNSLVVRCGKNLRGIAFAYNKLEDASEFVNCTFADNAAANALFGSLAEQNGNPVRAVNSAFFGTVDGAGNPSADLGGTNLKAGDVSLDHCAYGAADEAFAAFWTNVDASSFACGKPRFEADWQLHALSPLRGKGLLLDWTANDLDLAGNPRVRGGSVDLGCFQCWTNPRGTVFLVK